ncbi:MAG: glycoside hydrolase [Methyloceanibacter sp.]|nr:glycoside hydrolase [Methyloceanibacter sp.]
MTLANLYLNVDRKAADYRVTIGGVVLNVASVSYSFAVQKVPNASIRIRGSLPASVIFNASVEIEEGFVGAARQRVFTGTVLHPDNSDASGITIECQGMSACLDNAYHKVIVTVDGSRTVPELIEDLLALSGALAYSVNMPDWTAGAVVPQTLSFQTYGEAITKLAEVNGGRWYETPTGVIKVEPKDPIPALSAWRTYFSMTLTGIAEGYPAGIVAGRPRLRRCGQVRRAREVKNQVWVRGAVLTNTNPDGSESSVTLEEHAFAPSLWVLNPDGSQAYNDELYSNEIIDDAVVAGPEAGRRVGVKNRLLTQVDVEIDGDPQVQTGLTVGIEDPSYSAVTGRWFVEALTTTLSAGHYSTSLSLLGGPQAGGQINISPFANFLYSIEQEIMGDRPWDIVTLDGSPSIDPDGTIVGWCWSDNQTPMRASGCGETFTTRADPTGIVPPWEVTLTVEDNDGNTDDLMLSIPYESTEPDIWIPAIFVAFDTAASATPDGGINWYDQPIAGKSVISTSAKLADGITFGVGVFGTADGCIYRTTDFCLTAPTLVQAALGSPIEHLWWDILVTTRVWAITRNGKVYWSTNDGLTWALYEDLAAIFGLANIRLSRIATPGAGGLWIYGGTGTGWPLICWDAVVGGHSWVGADLTGGELEADLAISGYPTDLYVAEAATGGDVLAIILNSPTHTPPVYTSASGGLGDGTDWKRAVGDAGALAKTRGKWISPDLTVGHYVLGFDDSATYRMDVAAGVGTISLAPATFGTNKGNYCWSLAWWENIDQSYIVAAEAITGSAAGFIYKTWDRFGTVALVRPATGFPAAPALAKAKMIAFGAPGTPFYDERLAAMGIDADPREISTLIGHGTAAWSTPGAVAGITAALGESPRIWCLTDQLWFATNDDDSDSAYGLGAGARTKDAGGTWGAAVDPGFVDNGGVIQYALDAGGRIWCLYHDTEPGKSSAYTRTNLCWSEDEGDTWHGHQSIGWGGGGTGWQPYAQVAGWYIMPHPTDQNKIAVWIAWGFHYPTLGPSPAGIWYTTDRGVNMTLNANMTLTRGQSGVRMYYDALMLPSGRIVIAGWWGVCFSQVYITDDWGLTAGLALDLGANVLKHLDRLFADASGNKVGVVYASTVGGPPYPQRIWLSNAGASVGSFSELALAQQLEDYTGELINQKGRVAYSALLDTLYFDIQGTLAGKDIYKLTPVSTAGLWGNLTDAYPHIAVGSRNLCIIPRP